MAQNLYTVAENETVLFELECTEFEEMQNTGFFGFINLVITKIKVLLRNIPIIKCCCPVKSLLVVTDKRFIIITKKSGFFGCSENRSFKTIPVKALTGWNSYSKIRICCLNNFRFYVNLINSARESILLVFTSNQVTNDEVAQAIISKINELTPDNNVLRYLP